MGKGSNKIEQPNDLCIVDRGQEVNGTVGAEMPMHGDRSSISLDDILPPPAEDIIDNIREELDDDGVTWRPNLRSFQTTKTGFHKFEKKLQRV